MKFDKMIAILIFLFIFISLGNTYTIYHTVKKGENLYTIAKKYGKSVQEIKEFNKLKSSTVYPGQKLIVNKKEQKDLTKKDMGKDIEEDTNYVKEYYTVKKGDNLYKISKKFNISIAKLKKLNNLKSSSIKPGQILVVGMKKNEIVKKEINPDEIQPITDVSKKKYYKICEGDTLLSISEKFGIDPEKLLQANLIKEEDIKVGQIIIIPPRELLEEDTKEETIVERQSSNIRTRLIEETLNYLGVRYKYGGENKSGIDCSALTRLVYKTIGIILPQNSLLQYKNGIKIEKEEALPGDLVFFRRGGNIGHVGIYLGNDLFVHASYTLKRVVISSLSERYFKERFAGFRRYLSEEKTFFAQGIENVEQE